jgi:CheY-like chemotaxis protein
MGRVVGRASLPVATGTGRILVVDDDSMNRKLFSAILTRAGYQVTVACDGAEALALTAAEPPDLVLLDYMMPEMNGPEVLVHMRAQPRMKDVPILLVTASTLDEHIAQGRRAGADDYLFKPIDPPTLRARVATALRLVEERNRAAPGVLPEAVSQ